MYPIPEVASESMQKNYYRHFLGRLHRAQDFQFIVDGMNRILSQPLHEKTSYLPTSRASGSLAPETLMLFWETTQCNRRFRSFIVDTDRAHDFVILALFYALEYKNEPTKQGIIRMCAFLLQTLSVESNFGRHLNKRFEGQHSLPAGIRINGFRGTFADFLIQSIYNLITTSQGSFAAVYPALLAVINNIAPYVEGLSAVSCSQLMHLFASMSSPSFLYANETNHSLLRSLLESINAMVQNKYQENPELILAIMKNKKRIEALRSFTLESGHEEMEKRRRRRKDASQSGESIDSTSVRSSIDSSFSQSSVPVRIRPLEGVPEDGTFTVGDDDDDDGNDNESDSDSRRLTPAPSTPASENQSRERLAESVDDAVPVQLGGMSEKARGKLPAGASSFSRQSSPASLRTQSALARGAAGGGFEPTAEWIDSWLPELPLHTVLTVVQQVSSLLSGPTSRGRDVAAGELIRRLRETSLVGIEPAPARIHCFEWSQLALAWYESLLWGIIFASEMQMAKGTMGIWNGTAIKLFRVQETAPEGPTLTSPRGAVDAVGSNIVSRIGQINLRGSSTTNSSTGGS